MYTFRGIFQQRSFPDRHVSSLSSWLAPVEFVEFEAGKPGSIKSTGVLTMSKVFSGDQSSAAARGRRRDAFLLAQDPSSAVARGRRRNAFLLAHKKVFLPVLPEGNYIRKMADDLDCQKGETVKYESIREQPKGVRALLRPHQMEGLSFLAYLRKNGAGGILGDEMGLGKTLQILSFFQYTRTNEGGSTGRAPFLVVCPLSVLRAWGDEARRWTDLHVVEYHGCADQRARVKNMLSGKADQDEPFKPVDVLVTTYDTLNAEIRWLSRACIWGCVVLDEGHRIKNNGTKNASSVHKLRSDQRIVLTGTPIQNDLYEVWSIFHWLYPEVFIPASSTLFKDAFSLSEGLVDSRFIRRVRDLLEVIMLRREKDSPSIGMRLPPKTEITLYAPLSGVQRQLYHQILTGVDQSSSQELPLRPKERELRNKREGEMMMTTFGTNDDDCYESANIIGSGAEKISASGKAPKSVVRNVLMELRKCCIHPYLLDNGASQPYHLVTASGKFILLYKLIEHLVLHRKKKVLIFSGFDQTLNCCEDLLSSPTMETQFKFLRLDGTTSRARRNLNLYLFNNDPVYKVFLIATRAGGEGITLTSATEVVFLDQDWNPQLTLQAEARVHRIGQTQPVTVYKILTRGTVEEQMMSRLAKKLYLAAKITENIGNTVIQNGRQFRHFESGLLTSLMHREMQAMSCEDTNPEDMLSWKWDKIVEACSDRRSGLQNEADCEEETPFISEQDAEKQWFQRLEKVETCLFNGVIIPRIPDKISPQEDILSIINHADRRIGKNRTVLIEGFHINKESLQCKDDEAVPTMAGKDPRLAEWKREKKAEFSHEKACVVCGKRSPHLESCQSCPRVFHAKCVGNHHHSGKKSTSFSIMNRPLCPQHHCCTCHHTASEAGGMLFRCRCCHRAFCEGCLDWKMTTFLGDEISEWAVLGYAFSSSMYFVECEHCSEAIRKEGKPKKKRKYDFIATLASKRPKRGVGLL